MKLGRVLAGLHRRHRPAARRRGPSASAGAGRGVLARPLLPPDLLPAVGTGAARARGVLAALGGRGAASPGLRVGTLVARVTLRAPGMLAKQAAALDAMSGGHAILALGTGDRASLARTRAVRHPVPTGRRSDRAPGGDHRRAHVACSPVAPTPAARTCRPWRGRCCHRASPQVWVGGLSDAVIGVAARVADAWNGWGLDGPAFAEQVRAVARRSLEGRAVDPHLGWYRAGGARTKGSSIGCGDERSAKGLPLDGVWTGTAEELRGFASELEASGASWFIVLPVGPPDRLEVIAEALASR